MISSNTTAPSLSINTLQSYTRIYYNHNFILIRFSLFLTLDLRTFNPFHKSICTPHLLSEKPPITLRSNIVSQWFVFDVTNKGLADKKSGYYRIGKDTIWPVLSSVTEFYRDFCTCIEIWWWRHWILSSVVFNLWSVCEFQF